MSHPLAQFRRPVVLALRGRGELDRRGEHDIYEGDEIASLLKGLRLAVIALVSAVVTAGLVIGVGENLKSGSETPAFILVSGR